MSAFGEFVKARRADLRQSLRAFCAVHGVDPSNWSKMERGRLPPPQGERLETYASFLGLEKGTDEWYRFFDLAHIEAGRIPPDLTEAEVAGKLPAFFRTLREHENHGGSDDEQLLKELKAKIREA